MASVLVVFFEAQGIFTICLLYNRGSAAPRDVIPIVKATAVDQGRLLSDSLWNVLPRKLLIGPFNEISPFEVENDTEYLVVWSVTRQFFVNFVRFQIVKSTLELQSTSFPCCEEYFRYSRQSCQAVI